MSVSDVGWNMHGGTTAAILTVRSKEVMQNQNNSLFIQAWNLLVSDPIYLWIPPHEQDVTQGQFSSGEATDTRLTKKT